MSKYKLIKLYPGSHPVGCISKLDYSEFPEFWEKIEEEEKADFEILSLKLADGTILSYKNGLCIHRSDLLSCEETFSLKESLSKLNLEDHIYSVKRLSDGEIFTIGDEATVENRKTRYKITALKQPNNNWIQVVGKSGGNEFYYQLKNVQKLQPKTPLFTTEDGVAIFEEDEFWVVGGENICRFTAGFIHEKISGKACFSTEELAKESELLNKPCLSIVELQKWFKEYGITLTGLDRLKAIVKQKI